MVSGQQVSNTLVKGAIGIFCKVINRVLPIDDPKSLCNDLQDDKFIQLELSSIAGYLFLKGGRFVTLARGLLQVAKHVKILKSHQKAVRMRKQLLIIIRNQAVVKQMLRSC